MVKIVADADADMTDNVDKNVTKRSVRVRIITVENKKLLRVCS